MGIVFRQSIKSFLSVGAGAVLGAIVNIAGPHVLSVEEFGFSKNIINQAAVLQFFTLLGAHNTLSTFLPRYSYSDRRRSALLGYAFLFTILSSLTLLILLPAFRDQIIGIYQPTDRPLLLKYFWLLPAISGLWCLLSLLEAFLMTEKKVALMLFNKEVLQRCINLLLIGAVAIGILNFHGFALGQLVLYLIPVAFAGLIAYRTGRFKPGFLTPVDKASRREWISFSWYHLLTGVVLNLTVFIDSLLLPALDKKGLGSIAIYSTAVYVSTLLYIPYRAMVTSAYPVLNEAWIADDRKKVRDLFTRAGNNVLIVSVLLLLLIIAGLPVVQWLLPAEYAGVGALILVLLIGRFSDVASGMNGELLSLSSHYKFLFRISGALVVALVLLNVLLIPRFGPFGAAWSSSIALVLFNLCKGLYISRQLGIPPAGAASVKVVLAGACAATVFLIPDFAHPVLSSFLKGTLIILVYGIGLYKLRPSPDLQEYIQSVRENKRII